MTGMDGMTEKGKVKPKCVRCGGNDLGPPMNVMWDGAALCRGCGRATRMVCPECGSGCVVGAYVVSCKTCDWEWTVVKED